MSAVLIRTALVAGLLFVVAACEPSDRRPGLWLTGEAAQWPADWTFTDQIPEISLQVNTPYWVAHSVTIWSSQVGGNLYLGASAPETKRWPAWVDDDPDVRLKIDGKIYEARLVPLTEPGQVSEVQRAFAAKYQLKPGDGPPGSSRLWRVEQRTG